MIVAIVLASGSGSRFGGDVPKQFIKLAGKTLVEHTLEVFDQHPGIDAIVLVAHPEWVGHCRDYAAGLNKQVLVIAGGATRMDSSYAGIMAVPQGTTHVLIHDAVRPLVRPETVSAVIDAFRRHDAVDTVIPTSDTIVKVLGNVIQEVPDRSLLRRVQTPQGFELPLIRAAHEAARGEGIVDSTDDCQLVLNMGKEVFCVPGSPDNIKITEEFDLLAAECYFEARKAGVGKCINRLKSSDTNSHGEERHNET